MTPRILIIAGSDSGGGAGIQADIKTVTMLGGHAMTAVTAITAQNTLGVQAAMPVPTDMVMAQVAACVDDIGVDAVKIGMLGSARTAHAVADWLASQSPPRKREPGSGKADAYDTCEMGPRFRGNDDRGFPVVFDPVMVATSGAALADADTVAAFERLIALADVTTPNLPELVALGGEDRVRGLGRALLVKGGHGESDTIEDRLVDVSGETVWTHPRIATRHTHGTGCTLASAIATGLGARMPLADATDRAVAFVQAALAAAPGLGEGHGPMSHSLGRVPFYDLLTARDPVGWDAQAFAARRV
ncbi:bifunctional hydroxymethylpyrimidine kinase/phosphomethylpyrimidine kinase [Sphingomonas bacterium]|uniref:bifunctional hydroxymethylpyrimidine kinase/phosphomethylpyrimidine kinase n=1 Tax=Sphingomonas bacterium TaxID=1895847 RepID=UPI0015757AAE|nr:bifunctional hydroxymethylpyrimidine kinase/phosphomethylpyrimidine kinase [Sphingomonas bacterium]